MRAIAARWAGEAIPRLDVLVRALERLAAETTVDGGMLVAAYDHAHKLAGGAGTMGFATVSDAALPLDELLYNAKTRGAFTTEERGRLADLSRRLAEARGELAAAGDRR